MPTLTAPANPSPPWAPALLQPQTARCSPEEVNAKLDKLYETMQSEQQQRKQALESTVQLKEAELKEAEDRLKVQSADNDALRSQVAAKESRLLEEQQQHAQALRQEREDHDRTQRELMRAQHNLDQAEWSREKAQSRVQELERAEQVMSGLKASVEAQAQEREQELASRLASASDTARRLEGEKRAMEAELEKVRSQQRDNEQETRELRCRNAVLEDELRGTQELKHRCEQEQQKAVRDAQQDSGQWLQKYRDAQKENAQLQKENKDLKNMVWELENQNRQERVNYCNPGDLLKAAKAYESQSATAENNRLLMALNVKARDIELYAKRVQEQDLLIKELQHARACQKANAGA